MDHKSVSIRIPQWLYDWIEVQAQEDGRKFGSWIIWTLIQMKKDQGAPKGDEGK